jgi:hypothetical protein
MKKLIVYLCFLVWLLLITLGDEAVAIAGNTATYPLQARLVSFPHWENKPPVRATDRDLEYPDWMAGTWVVTSTLIEQFAPLAPKVVTPGFEENKKYLDRAIEFKVRFDKSSDPQSDLGIVADRAFNGLEIARSYLGDKYVLSVKTDPHNPNKQITSMVGDNKLISIVTGRAKEIPDNRQFIGTEVTQQIFNNPTRIYLNEVETTTEYKLIRPGQVSANQVTAIYLSPQDPDYFTALNSPVALYRYHLELRSTTPNS